MQDESHQPVPKTDIASLFKRRQLLHKWMTSSTKSVKRDVREVLSTEEKSVLALHRTVKLPVSVISALPHYMTYPELFPSLTIVD